MHSFFINLPLQYLVRNSRYLDHFIEPAWPEGFGFAPELGLDALTMQRQTPAWHEQLAQKLHDASLIPSIHLPFFELSPGSLDEYIRRASCDRLKTACDIAKIYQPAHLVGHARYEQALHAAHKDQWLERSRQTWAEILDAWPGHPRLYLENTHETEPEPVRDLVLALRPRDVLVCFDVGHWHSFARGQRAQDLDRWLDTYADSLGHLHLHDNDGSDDQHLGLGQGAIDWRDFFTQLRARSLAPGATFEPHTEDAMRSTLAFMVANKALFVRV